MAGDDAGSIARRGPSMFWNWRLIRSVAPLALWLAAGGGSASAAELAAACHRAPEVNPVDVLCDLQLKEPKEIQSVVVKLQDGKQLSPRYDPFNFKIRSSAWMFVVQRTSHPKDGAHQVLRLIKPEGKRSYGVYAFSDKLDEIVKLSANPNDFKNLDDAFPKRTEGPTALYTSLREALLKFADNPSERRALVVLADGRSERDTYREADVIELAKKNNIVIYALAFTDSDKNAPGNLAALRQLAEATGGAFADAGIKRELPADFVAKFSDYLESGGTIRLASQDVPDKSELSITANFASGPAVTADKVTVRSGPPPPPPPPPAPVGASQKARDWVQDNPIPAAAALALAASLLMLSLMALRRGRAASFTGGDDMAGSTSRYRQGDTVAVNDTVILTPGIDRNPPETVYGWLQFLDASSTRVPIGASNVRIGRHKDNDICLANKSVHRHHAVLHMTPSREFTIQDLGGQNGVVVNSQRVSQKALADGDLIEFGEVRLRYQANTGAAG